jgi:hypothetical protein
MNWGSVVNVTMVSLYYIGGKRNRKIMIKFYFYYKKEKKGVSLPLLDPSYKDEECNSNQMFLYY